MDNLVSVLTGVLLIALGLSFFWKSILALFLGDVTYWSGFLPITLISPLFIHLPPKEGTLIKKTRAFWIHFTVGPLFFFLSLALMSAGADQLGLPGSQAVNWVLTMGKPNAPAAITYSRSGGYKLNFLKTMGDAIVKAATGKVLEEQGEKKKL
jgi:uncharacterized membrane protein